jgi:hypothetical protein
MRNKNASQQHREILITIMELSQRGGDSKKAYFIQFNALPHDENIVLLVACQKFTVVKKEVKKSICLEPKRSFILSVHLW